MGAKAPQVQVAAVRDGLEGAIRVARLQPRIPQGETQFQGALGPEMAVEMEIPTSVELGI